MIRIRSSWLDGFPSCNRKAAAEWLLEAGLPMAKEYGLVRTRPNIGAIVGSGTHKGVAYLIEQFKATGWHGGMKRQRAAQDTACTDVREATTKPITTDDTTPTADMGIEAVKRLVERYHLDVRHEHEPMLIEKGLQAEFKTPDGTTHRLTGTMDHYVINGVLEDTKTGVAPPKPCAQMGAYSMIGRASGLTMSGGKIRFGQRVRLSSVQPAIRTIDFDPKAFESHAIAIAKEAAGGLMRMLQTGDPETFIANPRDMLCGEKYCPAYGTPFCPLGKAFKGE